MQEVQFDPRVGKIPRRRKWQPTPVFLPGKSHGQMSLAGYSPRRHKESDMTELLNNSSLVIKTSKVPPVSLIAAKCENH